MEELFDFHSNEILISYKLRPFICNCLLFTLIDLLSLLLIQKEANKIQFKKWHMCKKCEWFKENLNVFSIWMHFFKIFFRSKNENTGYKQWQKVICIII